MDADQVLLERWRDGDQGSGRELFTRYYEQLRRFFANKLEEPDELVQATFFALVKARAQFAGRSSFRTYLFTIARHELYRHLRTVQRDRAFDPEVSSLSQLAQHATSLGSRMARADEHRRLCSALRQLPIEQQTLLELHYWEDLDAGQLAEIFEAPPVTIRSRLSRARATLRELMELTSLEDLDTCARTAGRA